jgi:hypothetical protein
VPNAEVTAQIAGHSLEYNRIVHARGNKESPLAESPEANESKHLRPGWPIAAWVLITVVVAGTGMLATLYHSSTGLRDTGRFVVNHELFVHHWTVLETDKEFTPVIRSMADAWNTPKSEMNWSVKRLGTPASPAADLDAFETASLERFRAGEDEVWSYSPVSGSRYVRAVRVTLNCMPCHTALRNGQLLRENEVIGVISVDFRSNRPLANQSVALNSNGN